MARRTTEDSRGGLPNARTNARGFVPRRRGRLLELLLDEEDTATTFERGVLGEGLGIEGRAPSPPHVRAWPWVPVWTIAFVLMVGLAAVPIGWAALSRPPPAPSPTPGCPG